MLSTKSHLLVSDFIKQKNIISHDIKHCDIYIYLLVLYVIMRLKSIKYSLVQTWYQDIIYHVSMASASGPNLLPHSFSNYSITNNTQFSSISSHPLSIILFLFYHRIVTMFFFEAQVLPVLHGHDLEGYINGSSHVLH